MRSMRTLFQFWLLWSTTVYKMSAHATTIQAVEELSTNMVGRGDNSQHPVLPSSCSLLSLDEATATELMAGLEQGCFTSVDLVNAYTARINEMNLDMHIVMEVNPDARDIAKRLDWERAVGKIRGPLHGLPVLIKANIGTLDGMQTNAGSFALQNATVSKDSAVVSKLRRKGLVLLGKTSMAEWAYFRSKNVPHGWNPIFGVTKGAYYQEQCPGASSGGSAVATDLGLAWATIGTEGSIIIPSERNNIVGIKPTVGLTSRYMVVPLSVHQDTIGPLARTVMDAAKLLQVMAGVDPSDSYTSTSPFKSGNVPDYLKSCQVGGLKGKRIGIPRHVIAEDLPQASYTLDSFDEAIRIMKEAGALIVENVQFVAYSDLKARETNPILGADFIEKLPSYFLNLQSNPQESTGINELREFTWKFPLEEYPLRDTDIWNEAMDDTRFLYGSREYQRLLRENLYYGGEGGVLGALQRHQLDAIALPSVIAYEVPALAGSPIITVPAGAAGKLTEVVEEQCVGGLIEKAPGLPVGISFLGEKWSEEKLIEIAFAFEQRTKFREQVKRHRHRNPLLDLADVCSKSTVCSKLPSK